jgi:hypothetical protein
MGDSKVGVKKLIQVQDMLGKNRKGKNEKYTSACSDRPKQKNKNHKNFQ